MLAFGFCSTYHKLYPNCCICADMLVGMQSCSIPMPIWTSSSSHPDHVMVTGSLGARLEDAQAGRHDVVWAYDGSPLAPFVVFVQVAATH
ncbi:hypothetical protein ABBQ32_008307 [Trebouxia sp. C0010 RCD-2024]